MVFRVFKNQLVVGKVTSIVRDGSGMMIDVGPLEVFVNDKLMPPDLKYDMTQNSFISTQDTNVKILTGTQLRVKIYGMRLLADKMLVIGSINEDFLG